MSPSDPVMEVGSQSQARSLSPVPTVSRTQNVLGEKGRRIRELTAVVQKRFGFPEGSVEVNGFRMNHKDFKNPPCDRSCVIY